MSGYHELVVAGSYDLVRGFVTGFLSGRAFPIPAIFSRESGIRRISLGERVLSWTGVHQHIAHVIVDEGVAGDLVREIVAAEAGLDLKLVQNRRIKSATFDFHYKVFAKTYGEEIQAIFRSAPPRVTTTYTEEPKARVETDGKGIEMYAPEHEYELSAKGSVSGKFGELLPFFRKVVDHPLIEVSEISLEYEN